MLMYADDTTLYCNFNKDINEMIINIELHKVRTWLSANKLALNVPKTKFIMFRTLNKGMHYSMLKLNVLSVLSLFYFQSLLSPRNKGQLRLWRSRLPNPVSVRRYLYNVIIPRCRVQTDGQVERNCFHILFI